MVMDQLAQLCSADAEYLHQLLPAQGILLAKAVLFQVPQQLSFFCSHDVPLFRAALPKKGAKKQGPLSSSEKRPLSIYL